MIHVTLLKKLERDGVGFLAMVVVMMNKIMMLVMMMTLMVVMVLCRTIAVWQACSSQKYVC